MLTELENRVKQLEDENECLKEMCKDILENFYRLNADFVALREVLFVRDVINEHELESVKDYIDMETNLLLEK